MIQRAAFLPCLLAMVLCCSLPCRAAEVKFPTPSYEGAELQKVTELGENLGRQEDKHGKCRPGKRVSSRGRVQGNEGSCHFRGKIHLVRHRALPAL